MRAIRSEQDVHCFSSALSAIFEFMLASGADAKVILNMATEALAKATKSNRNFRRESPGKLALMALVLDAWHRDRRYLSEKALPRAVRLLGRAPSVEALIRAEDSEHPADEFARQLRDLGLVVPSGRGLYRPTSNIALISAFDPVALQHIAHSLTTLLETIGHNLNNRESKRLVERFAEVPDLPVKDSWAFQRFAQIQSWILLQTTNDWLESRRAKRTSSDSKAIVRAGVHVHAYISGAQRRAHRAF